MIVRGIPSSAPGFVQTRRAFLADIATGFPLMVGVYLTCRKNVRTVLEPMTPLENPNKIGAGGGTRTDFPIIPIPS